MKNSAVTVILPSIRVTPDFIRLTRSEAKERYYQGQAIFSSEFHLTPENKIAGLALEFSCDVDHFESFEKVVKQKIDNRPLSFWIKVRDL